MQQTVLLVEDQSDVAAMMKMIVSRSGHRPVVATNLEQARQAWTAYKGEIAVLITDNALPDGSGVHFAEQLRNEEPKLKVIVISGYLERDLPKGFVRLDKPFTMTAIIETLRSVVASPA